MRLIRRISHINQLGKPSNKGMCTLPSIRPPLVVTIPMMETAGKRNYSMMMPSRQLGLKKSFPIHHLDRCNLWHQQHRECGAAFFWNPKREQYGCYRHVSNRNGFRQCRLTLSRAWDARREPEFSYSLNKKCQCQTIRSATCPAY